jgi:thiamine pyrophosphokinase
LKEIADSADLLVAADSGLISCEAAGITPDWIVGDMDSLDSATRLEKYSKDKVLYSPAEKDFTDTELAINLLREKGCSEVWIAGGGGGRLDHLLAIRALFDRELPPDRWFPGSEEILCLMPGRNFSSALAVGTFVSLFPLGGGPWQAESTNLKWPLKGLAWERGSAWISNVVTGNTGEAETLVHTEIRALAGRFMVALPLRFCS